MREWGCGTCCAETWKRTSREQSACVALSFFVSRLRKWLACRAYVCVVRVFIKHTISFYISSFTPLYVYTSIRPIIFSHLPRSAILGTLKQPRPYSPAAPIGDALIATPSSSLDPCPWQMSISAYESAARLSRVDPVGVVSTFHMTTVTTSN